MLVAWRAHLCLRCLARALPGSRGGLCSLVELAARGCAVDLRGPWQPPSAAGSSFSVSPMCCTPGRMPSPSPPDHAGPHGIYLLDSVGTTPVLRSAPGARWPSVNTVPREDNLHDNEGRQFMSTANRPDEDGMFSLGSCV